MNPVQDGVNITFSLTPKSQIYTQDDDDDDDAEGDADKKLDGFL